MSCVYVYVSINYYSILLCPLWKLFIMTLDFCVSVCIISKLLNSYGLPILTLSNLYLKHTIVCILFISSLCCAIISDLDYIQWRVQGGGGVAGAPPSLIFAEIQQNLGGKPLKPRASPPFLQILDPPLIWYLFHYPLSDLYFKGHVSSQQLIHVWT